MMTTMISRRSLLLSRVFILSLLWILVVGQFFMMIEGSPTTSSSTIPKKFPYIYAAYDNYNASYPVIEYIVVSEEDNDDDDDDIKKHCRPDFLYSNDISTYRMIEFYVHWCDVCKNYKNQYIQLAKQMKHVVVSQQQNNVTIDFYAISCSSTSIHRTICKDQTTGQFPLLKLLLPYDNIGIDIISMNDLHPRKILSYMNIEYTHNNNNNDHSNNEEELLLWRIDEELTNMPQDNSSYITNTSKLSMKYWYDTIFNLFSNNDQNNIIIISPKIIERKFIKRTFHELKHDILLSFDFAMRNSVYISNNNEQNENGNLISQERKDTLIQFLRLMDKTIPISFIHLREIVNTILNNFEYINTNEEYMYSILDNTLQEYAESININNTNDLIWSYSCSKGDVNNGYTCGLWLLLHVITIGVVDYNRHVTSSMINRIPTEYAAMTIRNYINNFFGCSICREHFIYEYDQCYYNRCQRLYNINQHNDDENIWFELPLWLYETHNSVNVRLLYEKYNNQYNFNHSNHHDEVVVDIMNKTNVLWPLYEDCPYCWQNENQIDMDSTKMNHKYNKMMIYMFLKLEYGQRDEKTIEYRQTILSLHQQKQEKEEKENGNITIDTNETNSNNNIDNNSIQQHLSWFAQWILNIRSDNNNNNKNNNDISIVETKDDNNVEQIIDSKDDDDNKYDIIPSPDDIEHNVIVSFLYTIHYHWYHSNNDINNNNEPISPQKKTIMKHFIKLMKKTLPVTFKNDNFYDLLNDILDEYEVITNDINEYNTFFQLQYNQFNYNNNNNNEYMIWGPACSSKKNNHNIIQTQQVSNNNYQQGAYLCGIWNLLHCITIGLVDYNKRAPEKQQLSIYQVAIEIRDFITHFINYYDCSEIFLDLYEECEHNSECQLRSSDNTDDDKDDEHDWIRLSVWLYNIHNDINQSLLKGNQKFDNQQDTNDQKKQMDLSLSEDQLSHTNDDAVKWPSQKICPLCYNDIESLYKFLRMIYGRQDDETIEIRRNLLLSSHRVDDNNNDPNDEL